MAQFKQVIKNFSGGILEDKRIQSPSHFSITKHFDTHTYQTKLVPYAKRVAGNGTVSLATSVIKISRFIYAPTALNGASFQLWGLGDDGSGHAKIFKLDIDGASDLDTTYWQTTSNGASSVDARQETMFFYYKGFIYMIGGTTALKRFDVAESVAFNDAYQTLGTTTVAIQPVLHPSDDVAYFFSDNAVSSLNNTSFTLNAITLPSDYRIVAACPFGNYLAIGCVTKGSFDQRSIVFLWDRDSSLTTLTERIDMGEGAIIHLATLNNRLIAVMNFYANNAYGLGKQKIQIKTPSGNYGKILNELTLDTALTVSDLPSTNFLRDNRLYFPIKATLNGDKRVGIWIVDENGRLTLDQYDTALDVAGSAVKGIYFTANLCWIAYDDGTGAYKITRTDKAGVYDTVNPAIYESLILSTIHVTNRGVVISDQATKKKLLGVTVMTEPLPSGGQVLVKYRKNVKLADGTYLAETSWTTISTHSTANSMVHDAVNIESSGATLPQYEEIQFRLESTGGASITGFEYKAETIDDAPYD